MMPDYPSGLRSTLPEGKLLAVTLTLNLGIRAYGPGWTEQRRRIRGIHNVRLIR
jgi:hypothetical protein